MLFEIWHEDEMIPKHFLFVRRTSGLGTSWRFILELRSLHLPEVRSSSANWFVSIPSLSCFSNLHKWILFIPLLYLPVKRGFMDNLSVFSTDLWKNCPCCFLPDSRGVEELHAVLGIHILGQVEPKKTNLKGYFFLWGKGNGNGNQLELNCIYACSSTNVINEI